MKSLNESAAARKAASTHAPWQPEELPPLAPYVFHYGAPPEDPDDAGEALARKPHNDIKRPKAVRVRPGSLADNIGEALALLAGDPGLYQRGGYLARIVRISEGEAAASNNEAGRGKLVAGTPTIRDVPAPNLMVRLARYVPCEKWDARAKGYVSCNPPRELAEALACNAEYPGIRVLKSVAEAPFMRPDGSICQEPGYDAATCTLYAPSIPFPKVSDRPTRNQAKAALKRLLYLWRDFPFVDDAARAVAVAAVLTILGRHGIEGNVPAFLFDANAPGSGKSLTTDIIAIIASGRPMPRRTFPGPGEELRKVIDAYARDGAAYFCLDNIGSDFGGDAFDAALTTPGLWDIRVLGQTLNLSVAFLATILGTGNNISFHRRDTIERVLVARMECKEEDPRGRDPSTFAIKGDLRRHVQEHRAQYVVDALTILRAYVTGAEGARQGCRPWGSFEAWSALIAPAIRYAGGEDVIGCRLVGERAQAADPETQHLGAVLAGLRQLLKDQDRNEMLCSEILEALYNSTDIAGAYDALRAAIEGLCSRKRTGDPRPTLQGLGSALAKYRGRIVGGDCLSSRFDTHKRQTYWRVEAIKPAGSR